MEQRVTADLSARVRHFGYVEFIDGLRAIAVLSVVLYHAGISWLPGGYVGVDVFFVISGYLIINQIVVGLRNGRFSFSEFWSRRALRILPSYLLVIVACTIIAPFVLVMPGEYENFASEVAYSALMVVNHLFLSQQGYFDQAADTKILLHLWSLAVEEQFYIVTPLLLVLAWRFRRLMPIVAAFIFVASLVGCIYWTGLEGDKNYSFYVMPLRAWEFIAGGATGVAVVYASRLPRVAIEVVAAAGLAAIFYAISTFNDETPFPSYWAAVPVLGSCAVILAGLAGPNIVRSILAVRPMVGIGLVSYAWYLWHWPLLAFARIYNFGEHIPAIDASMAVLSFLLAVLTYIAIERPIRQARERRGRSLGWWPTMAGVATCFLVCASGYLLFNAQSHAVASSLSGTMLPKRPGSAGPCDLRVRKSIKPCLDKFPAAPMGVLIGDSEAAAATRAMVSFTSKRSVGLAALASGGCISLMTAEMRIPDTARATHCRSNRENAKRLLPELHAEYAILYSYWNLYADPKSHYYFVANGKKEEDQRSAFIREFRATVDYLESVGIQRMLVIGPTPTFPRPAPECVLRSTHYDQQPDEKCSLAREKHVEDSRRAIEWLNASVADSQSIRLIDPSDAFCDADFCRPYTKTHVLFNDMNHISDAGIKTIIQKHRSDFDWVLGKSAD